MRLLCPCVVGVLLCLSGMIEGSTSIKKLNTSEIIQYYGYEVEEYTIGTEDGYLLGIQRIPNGKNGKKVIEINSKDGSSKQAILLMHGLFAQSSNWVTNGPSQSLGFILADAGYDVWLGNSRGNVFSTIPGGKYDIKSKEFWEFSWDQMGQYDLPAMINYITTATSNDQIFYAGHSQGTSMGFTAFTENYNNIGAKVKGFFALAPVAYMSHLSGTDNTISPYAHCIANAMAGIGDYKLLTIDDLIHKYLDVNCLASDSACTWIFKAAINSDVSNLDKKRLPIYIYHNPAGTSTQNVVHFAQVVETKVWKKFDYGSTAANQAHYNSDTPPEYHPENLAVKSVLFYGLKDTTADPEDVHTLLAKLPSNLVQSYPINFTHHDFIWATNANDMPAPGTATTTSYTSIAGSSSSAADTSTDVDKAIADVDDLFDDVELHEIDGSQGNSYRLDDDNQSVVSGTSPANLSLIANVTSRNGDRIECENEIV